METKQDFFVRRAEEERLAASRATDPQARRAHQELAERYEERRRQALAS